MNQIKEQEIDFHYLFDKNEFGVMAFPTNFDMLNFLIRPSWNISIADPSYKIGVWREDIKKDFLKKLLEDEEIGLFFKKHNIHYFKEYIALFSNATSTYVTYKSTGRYGEIFMFHFVFRDVCIPKYLWNEVSYQTKGGKILSAYENICKKHFDIFECIFWFVATGDLRSKIWRYYTFL